MPQTTELPAVLYVQDDGRELQLNRTPEGALNRNLGLRTKSGEHVGVYKLDRVVQLARKDTVVEVAVAQPAEQQPAAQTQN